jgi:hypothetical protein
MNLYYSLNQQVPIQKVMNDIVKLCGQISQDEMRDSVLVIGLQKIMDYTNNPPIPKITHKELSNG